MQRYIGSIKDMLILFRNQRFLNKTLRFKPYHFLGQLNKENTMQGSQTQPLLRPIQQTMGPAPSPSFCEKVGQVSYEWPACTGGTVAAAALSVVGLATSTEVVPLAIASNAYLASLGMGGVVAIATPLLMAHCASEERRRQGPISAVSAALCSNN
jgi:hypothetical protein